MVRTDIADLVNRYVAVWNESDPHVRRKSISELWAPDGATYHRFIDARGREAVEARVAGSWVKWVQTNGYIFRSRRNVRAHHDVVAFSWEMVPAGGGEGAAMGLEFLVLNGENLIRFVYQFNDPPAPQPKRSMRSPSAMSPSGTSQTPGCGADVSPNSGQKRVCG